MATASPAYRAATHPLGSRAFAELTAAVVVLAACAGAAYQFLALYQRVVLPGLAPPAAPTPAYGVPLADREAVERLQRVKHLLGEASVYRLAHRADWAEEVLAAALALDPTNPEALAMRADWDAHPLPPPTDEQLAALARQERVLELLGAAIALLDQGEAAAGAVVAEARGYVEEALRLEPANPTALILQQRLTAS